MVTSVIKTWKGEKIVDSDGLSSTLFYRCSKWMKRNFEEV
jgi:hypothetical protein